MNKTQSLLNRLQKVECPDTTFLSDNFPIVMKKGRGLCVSDVDNRHYLDFTSCFGVLALGHNSKTVLHTMRKQMKKLIHGMGDVHPTEEKIKLLELLAQISPFSAPKTLLGLSGGDAIEAALKTAMLATGRSQFLSFAGGYHGLQFAPLSLNDRAVFTSGFESWIEGKRQVLPFPYFLSDSVVSEEIPAPAFFEEKHKLLAPDTVLSLLEAYLRKKSFAALVLEPIQGRGGKRAFTADFLQQCLFLCRKYGTLLIFDEVFTGFGRTGKLFALEHFGVVPDLLCLGKALGGGLPLSACLGDIMDVWGKSTGEARHTQTFLGHPLACSVAYATVRKIIKQLPMIQQELRAIDIVWQQFIGQFQQQGLHKKYPFVVCGTGFMKGLWFYTQDEGFCVPLMELLLAAGFLVLPEGPRADVLSLTPPLFTKAFHYKKIFNKLLQIIAAHEPSALANKC